MAKERKPRTPKLSIPRGRAAQLRMVAVCDPRTGQVSTQARRAGDARGGDYPAPVFFPLDAADVDHWLLPHDLRLARRDANVAALRCWLLASGVESNCIADPIVPLVDLITAAADACAAIAAEWGGDQEDVAQFLTGTWSAEQPASGLAAYAARKGQRDLWRQQLRDRTGPLERREQRAVDALDEADLWQLLTQVDYALDCYRDAGGAV